jgi:hypothetical protein
MISTARGIADDSPPWTLWKPGDGWLMKAEYYPPNAPPDKSKIDFPIHVIVQAEELVDKVPCWRLAFLFPSPNSKEILPKDYRVLVRKDNGCPVAIKSANKKIANAVRPFGNEPFVALFPKGAPLEILWFGETKENRVFKGDPETIHLTTKREGEEEIWEAIISSSGQTDITIRQTWIPGEKWWNHYERFRGTEKELVANRVIPQAPKKVPQDVVVK